MRNYIPHIIIAILFISIVFQCTDQISLKEEVATEKQKSKAFEKEIVVLNSNVEILNKEKNQLNLQVKSLDSELLKTRAEILTIRKLKDEKINAVSNLTPSQLQEYFSDRYPE